MSNILTFPGGKAASRAVGNPSFDYSRPAPQPLKDMTAAAENILPKQRRTNSSAMARNREFKDAMRQRIKDVAASRDLSEDEIKPAMTCKHQAIGEFAKKHGVNLEWLIAGKGRIFEKDPIVLGPNSTGSEFAAVVAMMPKAEQDMIEAMVDQILQERGL